MDGIGTDYIIDLESRDFLGEINTDFNFSGGTYTEKLLYATGYLDLGKSSKTQICYTVTGRVSGGNNLYSFSINIGNIEVIDKFGNSAMVENIRLGFQIIQ